MYYYRMARLVRPGSLDALDRLLICIYKIPEHGPTVCIYMRIYILLDSDEELPTARDSTIMSRYTIIPLLA